MTVSREQKKEILAKLEAEFKEAKSLAFVKNNKITVSEVSKIRTELNEVDAKYVFAKKTLIRIAMKNIFDVDLTPEILDWAVAVVICKEDPISWMGILNKYAKSKEFKKEEKLEFKWWYFEKKLMNKKEILKIADLPSKETLLSRFVMTMNAPISNFARFLSWAKDKLEETGNKKVSELEALAENSEDKTPENSEEAKK